MYCDASRFGLGCILIQNGKVMTYASRQLNVHEKNYLIHDLELVVVVFVLKYGVTICMGFLFMYSLITMSYNICSFRESLISNKRELLKDYGMNILYHPGKANMVFDSLSRFSIGSTAFIEEEKSETCIYTFLIRSLTNGFY